MFIVCLDFLSPKISCVFLRYWKVIQTLWLNYSTRRTSKTTSKHFFCKTAVFCLFGFSIFEWLSFSVTSIQNSWYFVLFHSKAINREYEEYVLTVGDFDERVFLGADADEEIGTPRKSAAEPPPGQLSARMQVENNLQQHFEKVQERILSLKKSDFICETSSSIRYKTLCLFLLLLCRHAPSLLLLL